MGQRKRRIEFGSMLEVIDRFVDVFARDGVIDVTAQTVATAKIRFVGFGVDSLLLFQPVLFV